MSSAFKVNELNVELLGIAALNPFLMHDSSSRLQMMCGHIGQSLVVKDSTVRRTLTGVEREYAKYTHKITMPCNATIIKTIQKYPPVFGKDAPENNPTTIVIYENADSPTREIGILELPRFHCVHQYFGFRYVYKPVANRLVPGAHIPKGTVIADSPSVTDSGDYKYGLEAQMALMSTPSVIEDGIIASESFCKRITTMGFGSRTATWGKNRYPLNLYGDENHYKPFPDIGDRVRDDGLLFAMRPYDEALAPVNLSPKALRRVDYFDRCVYAIPGARVVDVIVHKGKMSKTNMPSGMDEQTNYYHRKTVMFNEQLWSEYNSIKAKRRENTHISPAFNRMLIDAQALTHNDPRNHITHTVNRSPIDEWMVEIVFEYDIVPTVGFKLTCLHGGKGIICSVWPDEWMPVDSMGNRAELIMDDLSTHKRMNYGKFYEQYINASGLATANRIRQMVGSRTKEEYKLCWDYLMGFYQIISPRMYEAIVSSGVEGRMVDHIEGVIKDGIYLFTPTDTPISYEEAVPELIKHYPACYGPVQYRGQSGRLVTTKRNVLIGGMYMILLEKTGNTWAGVSSAKLQHFGIPARLTNSDKYSAPGRENPVRILGESEVRLIAAACGGDTVAELLDQTNNPLSHKNILNNILHADKPTNIFHAIDRTKVPRGNGRVLTFVRHVLECGGMRFVKGEQHA